MDNIVLVTVMFLSTVLAEDKAGSKYFAQYSRTMGHTLYGYVFDEYRVRTDIDCRKKCTDVANCLSVNIFKSAEGDYLCQLNSGRKTSATEKQFVKTTGADYFEAQKKITESSSLPWYGFNGSYYMLENTLMTWFEARQNCLDKGGDLASYHSEEEYDFLTDTFFPSDEDLLQLEKGEIFVYTGLNDNEQEGHFVWSDETSTTYLNFFNGEPNGGTSDNCGVIGKSLTWNADAGVILYDVSCSSERISICKKAKRS